MIPLLPGGPMSCQSAPAHDHLLPGGPIQSAPVQPYISHQFWEIR
ncbi:unnamed protein product, partial [Staurois parvus]